MPDRISVIEQYNNRDLIAQIYRIISLTESSTIVRVTTTQEGSHVTVTLEMYDGTSKTFTFDCVGDVTTDTVQNINALKNFMMGIGIVGPTHIDGDVRIVNGHYLQLAGDLDVGGDTELAGDLTVHGQSEIGGMSIEESSGKTVLSNDLGISTSSPFEVPTTDTGVRDTNAVNGERLQNDLDSYSPMVRDSGNQIIYGNKDFRGMTLLSAANVVNTGASGYKILYRIKATVTSTLLFIGGRTIILAQIGKSGGYKGVLFTSGRPYDTPWLWVCKKNGESFVVCRGLYSSVMNMIPINTFSYGTQYNFLEYNEIIDTVTEEPVVGELWDEVTEVVDYD